MLRSRASLTFPEQTRELPPLVADAVTHNRERVSVRLRLRGTGRLAPRRGEVRGADFRAEHRPHAPGIGRAALQSAVRPAAGREELAATAGAAGDTRRRRVPPCRSLRQFARGFRATGWSRLRLQRGREDVAEPTDLPRTVPSGGSERHQHLPP